MKKLYLLLIVVALICLAATLVLFQVMPTGSYVPFIPWLVYIIFLFIFQYQKKKVKQKNRVAKATLFYLK